MANKTTKQDGNDQGHTNEFDQGRNSEELINQSARVDNGDKPQLDQDHRAEQGGESITNQATDRLSRVLGSLKSKTVQLKAQATDAVAEASKQIGQKTQLAKETTRETITKHPLKATGVATGIGVVIGFLVGMCCRKRTK